MADDLPDPSWIWAWLRGVLVGIAGLVAIGIGLSLILPLPDHLPGVGEVRVVSAEDLDQKTKLDDIPEQTIAKSDAELAEQPLAKPDTGPVRDTGTESETAAGGITVWNSAGLVFRCNSAKTGCHQVANKARIGAKAFFDDHADRFD